MAQEPTVEQQTLELLTRISEDVSSIRTIIVLCFILSIIAACVLVATTAQQ